MKNSKLFLEECRLTCLGGSEKGTCSCRGPMDCEARNVPGFNKARDDAKRRMGRWLKKRVERQGSG